MLTIFGSDLSSPANKVRFVANYLGLPYEYKFVNLREGEHRKPEFLKVNPVGKIPAINDNGFTLYESNAICRYLADRSNSDLYPKDLKKRALVDQWIDFVTIHVGGALQKITYNRVFAPIRGVPVDENSVKEGIEFLARFLPVVDEQLGKTKYLTGDKLSIADFNLLALLDPAEVSQVDLTPYKNVTRFRNELRKEEFYTKCYKEYGEALRKTAAKK